MVKDLVTRLLSMPDDGELKFRYDEKMLALKGVKYEDGYVVIDLTNQHEEIADE